MRAPPWTHEGPIDAIIGGFVAATPALDLK
jgi:hypothetical protein